MACTETKTALDGANADFAAALDQRDTARQELAAAEAALAEADAAANAAELRVTESATAQLQANSDHNACLVSS